MSRHPDAVPAHDLVVDSLDRTPEPVGYHVTFRCACGGYGGEKTAGNQEDALALAGNAVRMHEATVTGAPIADIHF